MDEYRIRPALLFNFKLERRVLWLFWVHETSDDRYEHLVYIVRKVGGRLVNDARAALSQPVEGTK